MKPLISSLFLLCFLGTVVAGFIMMGFIMNGENAMGGGCIASALNGNICPENQLDFALRHIIAYQTFFNIFSNNQNRFFSIFAVILLALALGALLAKALFSGGKTEYIFKTQPKPPEREPFPDLKFNRWFALLEHSPSF